MSRGADSAADRELTARLAERGLAGSGAKYERWRRAGLLPSHKRHGAGRGKGSVSVLDSSTVEIAAALARHTVQGRDLRGAVVTWFLEAGHPVLPGKPVVPEPPDGAVVDALVWAVRTDPGYQLLQRARSALTEEQMDDFFKQSSKRVRLSAGDDVGFDPEAMREALIERRDVSEDAGLRVTPIHLVNLAVALGQGIEEIGADALADVTSVVGVFPQTSAEEWREAVNEAFASGKFMKLTAGLMPGDQAEALETAGIEGLRQAREVAIGLAGFGALLVARALLMPDSPGVRVIRAKIDELAVGPILVQMARQLIQPRPGGVAFTIANCLQPYYDATYRSLTSLGAEMPPLLQLEGSGEHDPEAFMKTWIEAIQAAGQAGG